MDATIASQVHEFWHGSGSWANLSAGAQTKMVQSLHTLPLELAMMLNDPQPPHEQLAVLEGINAKKHFLFGRVATAQMIHRLADVLAERAGFETHALPSIGHMGPITDAPQVARHIAQLASL